MTTTPQVEALVYLLVAQQEAHRAPAISRLQNLAYILQETVPSPIKVRFRLRYGSPSSDDLYDSISHLSAAGYLKVSDSPGPRNLTRCVTTTDTPLPEQVRALVPHSEQVDRVVDAPHSQDGPGDRHHGLSPHDQPGPRRGPAQGAVARTHRGNGGRHGPVDETKVPAQGHLPRIPGSNRHRNRTARAGTRPLRLTRSRSTIRQFPAQAPAQTPPAPIPKLSEVQSLMQTQTTGEYSAKDIQVLEGLEAVRVRPGMYIGSTDQRGLHHLIYEIIDNAVDESMAGFCDRVDITIEPDGVVAISDNGRGIPVDTHQTTGKTALETVLTTLHAGGKFGGEAYKVSGGLHGVGASVVNALSSYLRAEVSRNGWLYVQEYSRGKPMAKMSRKGRTQGHGTSVFFMPDDKIFGEPSYDFNTITEHIKQLAFLNKGLEINFVSNWHAEARHGDVERSYYFDSGITNLVRSLNRHRGPLHQNPFHHEKQVDGVSVETAIQYTSGFSETVLSFANCINTQEGGTHVTGFRSALTRVINDYAKKQSFIKDDAPNLTGDDVREGLTAVISVKLGEAQFEGQTKTKLGNAEVRTAVESSVAEGLSIFLEQNQADSKAIIEKCLTSQKAREAARRARDLVVRKNALDGSSLPGKLADCQEKDP